MVSQPNDFLLKFRDIFKCVWFRFIGFCSHGSKVWIHLYLEPLAAYGIVNKRNGVFSSSELLLLPWQMQKTELCLRVKWTMFSQLAMRFLFFFVFFPGNAIVSSPIHFQHNMLLSKKLNIQEYFSKFLHNENKVCNFCFCRCKKTSSFDALGQIPLLGLIKKKKKNTSSSIRVRVDSAMFIWCFGMLYLASLKYVS